MRRINEQCDNKIAIESLEHILKELKEENIRVTGCNLNYIQEHLYSPNIVKRVSFTFGGVYTDKAKDEVCM